MRGSVCPGPEVGKREREGARRETQSWCEPGGEGGAGWAGGGAGRTESPSELRPGKRGGEQAWGRA